MEVSLASHIADPVARLQAIHASAAAAKATVATMKSVIPTDFPSFGAPWLISGLAALFGRSGLANRMPPVSNVSISNVPGPQYPLYLAGAKMLTYYPVSIAIHSVALNITVQSYNGSLDFGLTACRKAMPDVSHLAQLMELAHNELLAASPAEERPEAAAAAPAPRRSKAAPRRKPASAKPVRQPAKPRATRRAAA